MERGRKHGFFTHWAGPSADEDIVLDKSRMNREIHVRFRESFRVKVPSATRLRVWELFSPSYTLFLKNSKYRINFQYIVEMHNYGCLFL